MNIKQIKTKQDIARASEISLVMHNGLRKSLPFLPERKAEDFFPRIEYMVGEGEVFGLEKDGDLYAFTGYFVIEDFRNAGPGAYTPDWCHGIMPGNDRTRVYRFLQREILERVYNRNVRLHCCSVYASDPDIIELHNLCGYGRIVMDAAVPIAELEKSLHGISASVYEIREAVGADAAALAGLSEKLAGHIGASPVLMPETHSETLSEWEEWLADDDSLCILVSDHDKAIGYLRGEAPQFDVTYSVHHDDILGINGLWIGPDHRGRGLASALLSVFTKLSRSKGKTVLSVDCETLNPEAYGFWTRYFRPVAYGMERRF